MAKRRGTAIVKEDFGIDDKVQKVRLVFAVWASVFIVLNGTLKRLYSMSALVRLGYNYIDSEIK